MTLFGLRPTQFAEAFGFIVFGIGAMGVVSILTGNVIMATVLMVALTLVGLGVAYGLRKLGKQFEPSQEQMEQAMAMATQLFENLMPTLREPK